MSMEGHSPTVHMCESLEMLLLEIQNTKYMQELGYVLREGELSYNIEKKKKKQKKKLIRLGEEAKDTRQGGVYICYKLKRLLNSKISAGWRRATSAQASGCILMQ